MAAARAGLGGAAAARGAGDARREAAAAAGAGVAVAATEARGGVAPAESPEGAQGVAGERAEPLGLPIGNPYVDPLTGLDTILAWERALADEASRYARYRRSVSVVALDIDGMVSLMRAYGPEPAGRIIPAVAEIVSRNARRTDRVAHIGAGRFLALLPETDEIQAINFVERVRTACDRWFGSIDLELRLVIGWANANRAGELEMARRAAEDRMRAERVHSA